MVRRVFDTYAVELRKSLKGNIGTDVSELEAYINCLLLNLIELSSTLPSEHHFSIHPEMVVTGRVSSIK